MKFEKWADASAYIARYGKLLDTGQATAMGPEGAVDWSAFSTVGNLEASDRLCISQNGPGVEVVIERWKAKALVTQGARATYVELLEIVD